jgi:dihydroorotate dehydrogenase electron transfer subunit
MYQQLAPIISNREVMPGTFLMWIESPQIAAESKPGQFAMISCGAENKLLLRRPISIYQVNGTSLAILFTEVGAGTAWLGRLSIGDKVDILGPLGNGFSVEAGTKRLLLVAGGMGIAPLCFLAQEALSKSYEVRILAGARTACQICPGALIPAACEVFPVTEDGTAGAKGLVTGLLPDHVQWADQIFICGPLPMFKAIAKNYSRDMQEKSVQASLEVRMGCGLGFCYACTIKTRQGLQQVCKQGPVFDFKDIIWDELK